MKLLSWNVNGIRAVHKNGFLRWFRSQDPDIVCLQETKAHASQLDEKLVRVAQPSIEELVHIVVVNHEQVAGRFEGPAQSGVGADRLADGVVL